MRLALHPFTNKEIIMTIRFVHIRKHDIFDLKPTGGITLAYELHGDRVVFSASKCSDKDHYNKKIGRAVTTGRMEAGNYSAFKYDPTVNLASQVVFKYRELAE